MCGSPLWTRTLSWIMAFLGGQLQDHEQAEHAHGLDDPTQRVIGTSYRLPYQRGESLSGAERV